MRVKILGSAAGGGFPQWNCACFNCSRLRKGTLKSRPRTQAQVAVSPDHSTWFLLNASPDLRQQLGENSEFAPPGAARGTPISAIILTSADVDCVLGLLHLREFQENSLFRTLTRSNPPVRWEVLSLDRLVPLVAHAQPGAKDNLFCKAVPLGGSFPDYVSDQLRRSLPEDEAVIGLQFMQRDKRFLYAPSLPGRGEDWKRRVGESQLAFLDATF